MAAKRMFSIELIDMDMFCEMPLSSQALYFHLGVRADDEGFVSPRRIMKMIGFQDDDLKILVAKGFVLMLDDGVLVITHWHENNYLDKNKIKPTLYQKQKEQLEIIDGKYLLTNGLTKVKLGFNQDRIEESRIEEINISSSDELREPTLEKFTYENFIDLLNEIGKRKFSYRDPKAKRQFKLCLKSGWSAPDFDKVIKEAYRDPYHISNGFRYLTPEFLTRSQIFERYSAIEAATPRQSGMYAKFETPEKRGEEGLGFEIVKNRLKEITKPV